jgi:hypothetical protein
MGVVWGTIILPNSRRSDAEVQVSIELKVGLAVTSAAIVTAPH